MLLCSLPTAGGQKANSLVWKYTPKRAARWCTALLDLNVPSFGRKSLAEWDEGCTASCKSFRKVVALFCKRFSSQYLEGAEGSLDIGWENRSRRDIFITGVLSYAVKKLYGCVEDVYNHVMWAGYVKQLLYGRFPCFLGWKQLSLYLNLQKLPVWLQKLNHNFTPLHIP